MKSIFVALALLALPSAALAQETQVWACEFGFQNTAPGVPANAVGAQFQIVFYNNGYAEGQGQDMGSSGSVPFQFQGQWQVNGRNVAVTGSKMGGMSNNQFFFQSNFTSETTMAYTHHYANGQVYASQCQRMQ